MKLSIALALVAALASLQPSSEARADTQSDAAAFLQESASAWNHGDLDTFMKAYEDAPSTVYVGSKDVIHGYDAIRAHYAGHYGKHVSGVLSFSDLSARPLGVDYALVVARWHLAMPSGARPTGLFSLVLHRSASGWHIITDHTP